MTEKDPAVGHTLTKADPNRPAFAVDGQGLTMLAGTVLVGAGFVQSFSDAVPVLLPKELEPGADYGIYLDASHVVMADKVSAMADLDRCFGGFHFAPGGAAAARAGGDTTPCLDPFSLWDSSYRPSRPDPRGMVLVRGSRGAPHLPPFWMTKYMLARDHLGGASRLGVTIADGRNKPQRVDGHGYYYDCNFTTVTEILAHHGMTVPSLDEMMAFAYGVTEKTAAGDRTEVTALDAPRTSWCGGIQASGQRWQWCHDGDPDTPRPSLLGGYYWDDGYAGSRYADGDVHPADSVEYCGARGRCDHLQLV